MKFLTLFAILWISIATNAQLSETLVPKDAVSVFSINNINLLQKISMDELVKYEFMEEVQQELFDGSTSGKTLKDSGLDFDQKLNVFFGRSHEFELSGFSFGIKNKSELFEVFDDFQPSESAYDGVTFYTSYFNKIAIVDNAGILFRVTPNMDLVNQVTDSLWYARGNDYPWYEFDESMEELMREMEDSIDSLENEEGAIDPIEEIHESEEEGEALPVADEDPTVKTYYELRDSVEMALQEEFLKRVCDELFVDKDNLMKTSPAFAAQLQHDAEGVFYFDNSRSLDRDPAFWQLRTLYPSMYKSLDELYDGNMILGDLTLNDNSIEMHLEANYGDKLGTIYSEMTDTKFDKNALKYIHKDNSAFFTYRIDLRKAYQASYDVICPMLEKESDVAFAASLLLIELLDELINKDAIFDTYKGSMFGSYNGIQKVKTKKIVFDYDEETFEYTEREEEAEEDMPLFVLGFSTASTSIPEKILKYISRVESKCRNEGDYWVFDDAILNAAPLYILLKNDLFIFTNDEKLAKEHPMGFGANALGKSMVKKAKKSGFMYSYIDLGKAIEDIPRDIFNDEENEIIDVVRGKSGTVELTSSKSTTAKTSFNLSYEYDGEYDESGTYILDLINSLYVLTK